MEHFRGEEGERLRRQRTVSTCPKCGHKANVSKWWTKGANGKVYHYFKFYHSSRTIHLVPTDNTYSIQAVTEGKKEDINAKLLDFIHRRMHSRKYSFTAFKKEFERFIGHAVYNESFLIAAKKAISSKLLLKKLKGKRPVYERSEYPKLDEEIRFDKLIVNYDLTRETVKVTSFLEVTNIGNLPVRAVPLYIPYGTIDSPDSVHLEVRTEEGEILERELSVPISNAIESTIAITLKRPLQYTEQEYISVFYKFPLKGRSIRLVTKATVDVLRLRVSTTDSLKVEIVRTLIDSARDARSSFQNKYRDEDGGTRLCSEFEGLRRGECVSVRLNRNGSAFPKIA